MHALDLEGGHGLELGQRSDRARALFASARSEAESESEEQADCESDQRIQRERSEHANLQAGLQPCDPGQEPRHRARRGDDDREKHEVLSHDGYTPFETKWRSTLCTPSRLARPPIKDGVPSKGRGNYGSLLHTMGPI